MPDAPLYANGGSATFSELGVPTQEFTGRRFRTEFAFGIPSDFYANDYGEATLLLDAAYSPSVLPGSHIDVYVNGNIASTLPVSQAGGAILRQLPISVTMRHLKPGVNIVTLEAVLLTESDAVCAPGTTAGTDPRFVIFETSKLEVPRFARVARRPNLSGLVGTGFPYNIAADRVPLILEPSEPDALSAAAALLGSMSVAGGRAIAVDVALSPSVANGRDAIFVGSIGRVPAETLSHFGISPESQVSWAGAARPAQETSNGADTQATFDRWRKELSGSGWRGRVSSLEEWLSRNFDFTVGSLFSSGETTAYVPKQDASIMLAQQASTGDTGTWTLLTAPSARQLRDGMQGLAALNTWRRVDGRITTLNGQSDSLTVVPLSKFEFVPTQPTSIINYRLILANWLSANVLVFAGWLVVMCTILGLATASLLSAYGRRT